MEWNSSWQANSHSGSQEIHCPWGNSRFITMSTRVKCIQSTWFFLPVSLRYILILSYHLHPDHPSGLFLSSFMTKVLCAFLISPVCATCSNLTVVAFYIGKFIYLFIYEVTDLFQ